MPSSRPDSHVRRSSARSACCRGAQECTPGLACIENNRYYRVVVTLFPDRQRRDVLATHPQMRCVLRPRRVPPDPEYSWLPSPRGRSCGQCPHCLRDEHVRSRCDAQSAQGHEGGAGSRSGGRLVPLGYAHLRTTAPRGGRRRSPPQRGRGLWRKHRVCDVARSQGIDLSRAQEVRLREPVAERGVHRSPSCRLKLDVAAVNPRARQSTRGATRPDRSQIPRFWISAKGYRVRRILSALRR
jgi:hypothetical protein